MSRSASITVSVLLSFLMTGCATRPASPGGDRDELRGLASWYGQEFAGRATANGEIFDPNHLTAAHRTLPFGTVVEVKNLRNQKVVRVRINDRGPFVEGRVIDLSWAGALALGMVRDGVVPVELKVIGAAAEPAPPPALTSVPGTRQAPDVPFPLPSERRTPAAGSELVTVEVVEQTAAAGAGWRVQVGAFTAWSNADELRRKAELVADRVYIQSTGEYFRVRVGPFATQAEAIDVRERLEAAGFDSFVFFE